jgi:hypothetical protein
LAGADGTRRCIAADRQTIGARAGIVAWAWGSIDAREACTALGGRMAKRRAQTLFDGRSARRLRVTPTNRAATVAMALRTIDARLPEDLIRGHTAIALQTTNVLPHNRHSTSLPSASAAQLPTARGSF